MSWSITPVEVPKGTDPDGVYNYIMENANVSGQTGKEVDTALDEAAEAATTLINTGCCGSLEKTGFRVHISGHVNPNNVVEINGGIGDCVTITVAQLPDTAT
jgi:hypothetical protein